MHRALLPAVCLGAWLAVSGPAQIPATITPRPAHPAVPGGDPRAVLRADSSLVIIPTWVTTDKGISVTNLSRENFHLMEDDTEKQITYFAKDDAPVSVGLLFDASGSMRNKMDKAAEALAAFFRTADRQDEFFLVEFSDRAKLTTPFTTDPDEIYMRIARTKPFGKTSLLDAIQLALTQMKKAKNLRKAIVIISDGGDNWSRHTAREIRAALMESDVQLYAMGIFDPDLSSKSPTENRNGPALLDDLAEESGGRHFPVSNLNDLPAISARIGNALRNEYLLGYYSTDSRDGRYHRIRVNPAVPQNMPPLRASYRKGYYAATQ